jgi:hypothetical protein
MKFVFLKIFTSNRKRGKKRERKERKKEDN